MIPVRGFADGLELACVATVFVAGFLTAGFAATVALLADFLAAGFWVADFPVVAVFNFVSRPADCFPASFFAVAFVAALDFRAVALALSSFRADDRDDAAFWVVPFAAARFVPEPSDRAGFGFVSLADFGRDTFTRPRMARPDDRPLAAAFTVARPVDLLCEVEAMGTTLVTVVTR
jgi:hypothetical protein